MHPARQSHDTGGIARDTDVHALPAKPQVVQGE
jgi:hypothetical protein